MPRIYNSASEPLDFCLDCWPDEEEAEEWYGKVAITGEGPDKRGNCFTYDAEHPDYGEGHDMYECHECQCKLTDKDNYV